jgi:hypothetical protein
MVVQFGERLKGRISWYVNELSVKKNKQKPTLYLPLFPHPEAFLISFYCSSFIPLLT